MKKDPRGSPTGAVRARAGHHRQQEEVPAMQWIAAVLGLGLIAVVVFGLVTGRLDRHAEACCTADPSRDLRMRAAFDADRDAAS
jgi:hypothetical protein